MEQNFVKDWNTKRFEFIMYRKRNNINQRELSKKLHVSSNSLSCIELGYKTPTVTFMNLINDAIKGIIKERNECSI